MPAGCPVHSHAPSICGIFHEGFGRRRSPGGGVRSLSPGSSVWFFPTCSPGESVTKYFAGQTRHHTSVIPALWEAKTGGSLEPRSSSPAWATKILKSLPKIVKISWVCWCMPAVPATWEAEAGGSLEPRSWRLQ
uniref:Uncharacterized protein n=1 Tax=Macaca fascicularis TaxID=9541 RepID=A0A7N9C994_MACFA